MPTPFSPESVFWIIAAMGLISITVILMEHKAANRVYRMYDKLLETNRLLSLMIAHPDAAARLEQKRQATENDQNRKVALSDIFGRQGKQRQARFKQDRAANPPLAPRAPSLRFVPLADTDVVPPKERPDPSSFTPLPEKPE